jgi:hypothetical protein
MCVHELYDKTLVLYFVQVMRHVKIVVILTLSLTQMPDTFKFISSDPIGMHSRHRHTGFQKCNSNLPATIENTRSILHTRNFTCNGRLCHVAYGKEVTILLEPCWHT